MLALLLCAVFAGAKPVHPFLYRVTVGGHVSWLLGSIQSDLVRVDDFDRSLTKALTQVRAVFYDNRDPLTSFEEIADLSRLPRQPAWSGALPAEARSRYLGLMNLVKWRFDVDHLPGGAAMAMVRVISQLLDQNRAFLRLPFDFESRRVSEHAGASMLPLNENADNLRLLNAVFTPAAFAEFLTTYLDERGDLVTPAHEAELLSRNTERYRRGEPPERLGENHYADVTPLRRAELAFDQGLARNHLQWYPRVLAAMRSRSVLVNVGVPHLTDDGGLLEILRAEKDVEVTRMADCAGSL